MVEVESGSTYKGKINCDALCFWLQSIFLLEVGWALWEMVGDSRSLLTPMGLALFAKGVLLVLTVFALCRWRPLAWAVAVTGTALYGIVYPLALVGAGARMAASRSSISLLFAQANFVGAAILFGVLVGMSYVFWKSYRAFDVPAHHRWRLLVRPGIPVALLLLAIDVYRFYDQGLQR